MPPSAIVAAVNPYAFASAVSSKFWATPVLTGAVCLLPQATAIRSEYDREGKSGKEAIFME